MPSFVRKRKYTTNILRGDFFVLCHLKRFIVMQLKKSVSDGKIVADIGCGEQPFRSDIESLGGIYLGIDVQQNSQGNVAILAPVTAIPEKDNAFDVILLTEVLEHVSDTFAAFQELRRVLKPQGTLILTTPFMYPLHEEPHDFMRVTPHQLNRCAENTGFKINLLIATGNEFEVIATVWDNMWARMNIPFRFFRNLVVGIMRLTLNLPAAILSVLFGKWTPRKSFLSTVCVFQKVSES